MMTGMDRMPAEWPSCPRVGTERVPPRQGFPAGMAMAAFARRARKAEGRLLCRLPPDNAPVDGPSQSQLLWDAMAALGDQPILFALEGPFTALSRTLPLEEVYAAAMDGGGEAIFASMTARLTGHAAQALRRGAALLSVADPVAAPELTGTDFFRRCCAGPLAGFLSTLRLACPHAVIHLCPSLAHGLTAAGVCRVEPLLIRPQTGYERALLDLAAAPDSGGVVSSGCLAQPRAPGRTVFRVIPQASFHLDQERK